jgi:hypothetical protein
MVIHHGKYALHDVTLFFHVGYAIRQRKRKRIEECFGWLKTIALLRKVGHRGILKVGWNFTFAAAAYNCNSSDVGQSRSSTGPKKDLLATSVGGQSSSLSHKISNWGQDLSRIIHFSAA